MKISYIIKAKSEITFQSPCNVILYYLLRKNAISKQLSLQKLHAVLYVLSNALYIKSVSLG